VGKGLGTGGRESEVVVWWWWLQNPQLAKGEDETSSVATCSEGARSPGDVVPEHLSTPSPDTSEYNSENEVEGSSVAEEENDDPPVDDDDDDDDDDDEIDDYEDERDDDVDQSDTSRAETSAERVHPVSTVVRLFICSENLHK